MSSHFVNSNFNPAAYFAEQKLTSTPGQKATSGGLSIAITTILIFILMFVKISVPNPPYTSKQPEVEIDLGITSSYGDPNQGGPSPTPPELGNGGGGEGNPNSTPVAGGAGNVVTDDKSDVYNGPPIDPPQSDGTSNALKDKLKNIGNRKGKPGNPNGIEGGSGNIGWGPGKGSGITGNHGKKPGNGIFGYDFTNYKVTSTLRRLNADGVGTVACRVTVDCDGRWIVSEYGSRGTTYNGSVEGLRNVVTTFLRSASFEKIGKTCPESGIIYIEVKNSY